MINPKFIEAKERVVIAAQRIAGAYLLSKYGSAHFNAEPKVELTAVEGPTSSSFIFQGNITCYAAEGLLNQVGVNMTVNENDIEVTSEDVQGNISSALNAAEEHPEQVVASLDGFRLIDDGTIYLKVAHVDLQDATIGIVGKNEYTTSKDRAALLQGMVKDAMLNMPVTFTGEFKEPTIEKAAKLKDCWKCGTEYDDKNKYQDDLCDKCRGAKSDKKAALAVEVKPQATKTWLTADFLGSDGDSFAQFTSILQSQYGITPADVGIDGPEALPLDEAPQELADRLAAKYDLTRIASGVSVGIKEDMPKARTADTLVQAAQLEEQTGLEAQIKVEHEAANALLSMLQGMGYGSAKIVESSKSDSGLDFMAAIDDGGSVKAVSIPVSIKEAKVVLPKRALVSTLISKGLDVKAKLAEQFDLDLLERLAAIDEKIAFEAKEAEDILSEKVASVEKAAAGEKQPFFDSDDSTLTVQKHLLPNHEDLKVGDRISDGTDQYEIVNQDGQQNSKGEGDSSLWTLKKCQAPEHSNEEPKNKIPS